MSLNFSQTIKCPSCGQVHSMTAWSFIDVSDNPDLKEDLLKGKVNIFECPDCSYKAPISSPLLYFDESKNILFSFVPSDGTKDKHNEFEEFKKRSVNYKENEKFKGRILRYITGYNEILEKILVYDEGLSDKVTELIKLMILMQEPEKADKRVCIFGKRENDELEFMVQDFEENQIYTSRVPLSTYDLLRSELKNSGVKLDYSFDWEMVDTEYASSLLG